MWLSRLQHNMHMFTLAWLVLEAVAEDGSEGRQKLQAVVERLDDVSHDMQTRHMTLSALEELRTGLLSGERIDMPSAQRQHLEKGSPLIGEVTFDARHRPISTNATRHFQYLRTLAPDVEVLFHAFMPLKRVQPTGYYKSPGPAALLVLIDKGSRFSAYDPESGGPPLLGPIDLGHGARKTITHLATTTSQESHLVVTADSAGAVRVHSLRVVARRENVTKVNFSERALTDEEEIKERHQRLNVTVNLTCEFSLPSGEALGSSEVPRLNAVLPIERGEKTYFATGDSLGGIAVFFRNGTLKGRVRVTEDPGGVRGLLRGQSQMVVFFSSHSFGSFSVTQIDVQSPPCSGWNSPVHDVVLDPSYQSSRVVLALSDGDVLVFSTTRGKSKACDLTFKFPHVSAQPFKLQAFRGHVMALTSPLEDTPRRDEHLREIYFFNLAAMEVGLGASPSRAITLQAAFKPKQPEDYALSAVYVGAQSDRTKSHIGIRFAGMKGIDLFSLSLKPPPAVQAAMSTVAGEQEDVSWSSSLLSWFPKIGIFGVALIGVILWNLRKAANQPRDDELDEEFFQEQLRKARAAEKAEKEGRAKRED
mmetsp:Transcript_30091/g.75970  ORF Transcript_30091/g.75970 Transcript_30091/m.75970 type:complete len:590 (+) Transcript_30091:91-1860(+)